MPENCHTFLSLLQKQRRSEQLMETPRARRPGGALLQPRYYPVLLMEEKRQTVGGAYSPLTAVQRLVNAAVWSLRTAHSSRFITSSFGANPSLYRSMIFCGNSLIPSTFGER